jgi:hypothetical protein
MIKIQYKDNAESVGEALLIPKERREDLVFRMSLIIHDFLKPTKDHVLPNSDQILKLFIALAENNQELAYLAYCAGEKTFEIFSDLEQVDDEMFDDEEY